MKKEQRSCIRATYPETSMRAVLCYDGEVVMQTHEFSKRLHLVSISVKGGVHQIFNGDELEVTVLHGKVVVQVRGHDKVTYNGSGNFVVPRNSWVKIEAKPFAQFFAKENIFEPMGDNDGKPCDTC